MGGGGTMRSAASRIVGFTAATNSRRVFASDHYPISSLPRRDASSSDQIKLTTSPTRAGAVRAATSEIDDWVFAGGEEVLDVDDPMPRVVFGGAPTLEEAKEATSELADALEKAYLSSPKSIGMEDSSIAENGSWSSRSSSHSVQNKACVSREIEVRPAAPSHAMKAFKLLNESPAAQTVVASIACDPNVWTAVLKNPQLQEFLLSQKTFEDEGGVTEDSDVVELSPKSVTGSSDDKCSEPDGGFMDFIQKVKSTVVDMMSSLSDFFQSFFGGPGLNKLFVNPDGTARVSAESVMEASFMGLAVMAIMVILMKRV